MPRCLVLRDVQNRVKAGQSTDHDDLSRYARITVPILPGPTIMACDLRTVHADGTLHVLAPSDSEDTRLAKSLPLLWTEFLIEKVGIFK